MTNCIGIKRLCRVIAAISCLGILEIGLTDVVLADSVLLGSDYFHTLPGTFYDFPPIGAVDPPLINFRGRPLGPGNPPPANYPNPLHPVLPSNADTIVQRQADAILPTVGSSATIPTQMVALSLESVSPVNIGGSFFDVFVHLTPGTTSSGTMTINHEFPDNGTPVREGTFSSSFHLFFTADFTPTGAGTPFSFSGEENLTQTGGLWSHEPPANALLVPAPPSMNQIANLHLNRPAGFNDFFLIDSTLEISNIGGQHQVEAASAIPEPSTLLLLCSGLAGIAWIRKGSLSKDYR